MAGSNSRIIGVEKTKLTGTEDTLITLQPRTTCEIYVQRQPTDRKRLNCGWLPQRQLVEDLVRGCMRAHYVHGRRRTHAGCGACVTVTSQLTGNRPLSIDAVVAAGAVATPRRAASIGRSLLNVIASISGRRRLNSIDDDFASVDLISSPVPRTLPSPIWSPLH